MNNVECIRRVCTNKDQAMLLVSRLEGRRLAFYQQNDEYVVEFERQCTMIEGEYEVIEEENKNEIEE